MENPNVLLLSTPLFAGITAPELDALLPCLRPVRRQAEKGDVLLACGQENHSVGIVLSGEIEASRPLAGGGTIPVSRMGAGGVFGDVLGGTELKSPVTVTAAAACEGVGALPPVFGDWNDAMMLKGEDVTRKAI